MINDNKAFNDEKRESSKKKERKKLMTYTQTSNSAYLLSSPYEVQGTRNRKKKHISQSSKTGG